MGNPGEVLKLEPLKHLLGPVPSLLVLARLPVRAGHVAVLDQECREGRSWVAGWSLVRANIQVSKEAVTW
jgi:hypothetical protein